MTLPENFKSPTQGEVIDTSHKGIVMTVTSALGGTGKSTVSSLLASQISKSSQKSFNEGHMDRPLKVCVVDLDIFDSQLGFLIGVIKPTSLDIALSEEAFIPELVFNNLAYSSRMGFHALLAPIRYQDQRTEIGPEFYRKVITTLRTLFDVIILDTSSQYYNDVINDVALPESDAILLVTTLGMGSLNSTRRWIETASAPLEKQGHDIDIRKIGIVVNQSIKSVYVDDETLRRFLSDIPALVAIPLDTVAVQAAGNSQQLETLIESHASIGNAYFSLAEKIASKLHLGLEIKLSPIINK